jgi:ornithine cyclodeaminase/alanine dehydrogenase
MKLDGTLLIKRTDVAELLGLEDCIVAVERAFKLHGEGKLTPPGVLSLRTGDGGFHIKAALLPGPRSYFAAKLNGNFFQNAERFNLPNIQGLILLCDGEHGYPLAVMDSIEITILRTGAATAVAAKRLARPDARVATICGCGNQGRIQLKAVACVLPLEAAFAFDVDEARAQRFADELSQELGLEITATRDLANAVSRSDVCVTCTPAREPFLRREYLRSGTFIAAVGADSPDKQELEPSILGASKVVVDVLEQCVEMGELNHALKQGAIRRDQVYAELGEIVAGRKSGRASTEEIIVFDSTGTGFQDSAAAAIVYERALGKGKGDRMEFAA